MEEEGRSFTARSQDRRRLSVVPIFASDGPTRLRLRLVRKSLSVHARVVKIIAPVIGRSKCTTRTISHGRLQCVITISRSVGRSVDETRSPAAFIRKTKAIVLQRCPTANATTCCKSRPRIAVNSSRSHLPLPPYLPNDCPRCSRDHHSRLRTSRYGEFSLFRIVTVTH